MASYPVPGSLVPDSTIQQEPHAAPYCNDPDCKYCKQLRDVQDLIRMHDLPSPAEENHDMQNTERTPTDR